MYGSEQTVCREVPILRHEIHLLPSRPERPSHRLRVRPVILSRGTPVSYQGARARSPDDESGHVFAISKVRLDDRGWVTDVLWCEISAKSNLDVGASVIVPVADVIDALHDGARVSAVFPVHLGAMPDHAFEVIEFTNGLKTIALVPSQDENIRRRADLNDLARLDG